jgi:hypothetical protein
MVYALAEEDVEDDEEIGTSQSYPEINAKIKEILEKESRRESSKSGLESTISPGVFLNAARRLARTETGGYVTKAEIIKALRDLEKMGMPIEPGYRDLQSRALYRFFVGVKRDIFRKAIQNGYDPTE